MNIEERIEARSRRVRDGAMVFQWFLWFLWAGCLANQLRYVRAVVLFFGGPVPMSVVFVGSVVTFVAVKWVLAARRRKSPYR